MKILYPESLSVRKTITIYCTKNTQSCSPKKKTTPQFCIDYIVTFHFLLNFELY